MSRVESPLQGSLPYPGRVLRIVMIAIAALWLAFAIGLNWAGAPPELFWALCGNTDKILHGEVWRLFTAPWLHLPVASLGHVFSALLGLYFLGASLEQQWGSARFAKFLFFAALLAYVTQMLAELVLPRSLEIAPADGYWFGAIPVVEAIAIAWALSFRGREVRLFFVLPVSSTGLILFVVGASVASVIIKAQAPSGLVAPFGGMLAGWLFGSGSPSPLRRLWLKLRLAQLDVEAKREAQARRNRAARSGLKVITGGRDDDSEDDSKRGGGRWLN
ncbi:MAG TPA: rhomboid family intramembrane serine protease [Polyangiaceae bacterium]|nr:rhomboid family intramembrane serine protease [Polyangiaceae bacterium]